MIGIFLKNKDGKLCFVQPQQDIVPKIAAFRYEKDSFKVAVTIDDGREEMFTTVMAPEMRDSFLCEKHILVVNLDEESEFKEEYKVPLVV